MSEVAEQMYCSQQICIPPTFPYLLRQFAKAAIRTQPNDLLKWSTTYFRCLALNIPPPVKPRLEYPIPKDYCGMTPGWLRALLQQMQGAQTVSFRVLWDRWIGACLQHNNLIQILCLGGFEDNTAVPWLRFIALCAAHLTDSLTQTMVLICEILTEEPEGGSAMIPAPVFLDLYQFLARIDASVPQTLRNYYFLDKFLELFQEKIAKDQGLKEEEGESSDMLSSEGSSEMTEKTDHEPRKDDAGSVVSCPSVASQDPDNFMKMLMKIQEDELEEEAGDKYEEERDAERSEEKDEGKEPDEVDQEEKEGEEEKEDVVQVKKPPSKFQMEDDVTSDADDNESRETRSSSEKEEFHKCTDKKDEDQDFLEDLERLKMIQQQLMGGESDDEVEKFKQSLLAELPQTESQQAARDHFTEPIDVVASEPSTDTIVKADVTSSSSSSVQEPVGGAPKIEEKNYEEVFVEAVPGIGGKVPEEMITAVFNYMKVVAELQHNMVMPRNIRHYKCPPLEVVKN